VPASGAPAADDDYGAARMVHTRLAHGAEQKPRESAVSTRADDEEVGILRRVQQRLSRMSFDHLLPELDSVRLDALDDSRKARCSGVAELAGVDLCR